MQLWEVKWFSYIVTLMNEETNSFRKKNNKKRNWKDVNTKLLCFYFEWIKHYVMSEAAKSCDTL